MDGILLIVDDEKHTREGLVQFFSEKFDVFTASQPLEAFKLMESEKFDVIITDLRMGQQSGLSVIDKALNLPNRPVCIMMTAYGSIETAVEAMKHGAYDFISKPIQLDKLENMVQKALFERKNAPVEVKKVTPIPNMLGNSKAFETNKPIPFLGLCKTPLAERVPSGNIKTGFPSFNNRRICLIE